MGGLDPLVFFKRNHPTLAPWFLYANSNACRYKAHFGRARSNAVDNLFREAIRLNPGTVTDVSDASEDIYAINRILRTQITFLQPQAPVPADTRSGGD